MRHHARGRWATRTEVKRACAAVLPARRAVVVRRALGVRAVAVAEIVCDVLERFAGLRENEEQESHGKQSAQPGHSGAS